MVEIDNSTEQYYDEPFVLVQIQEQSDKDDDCQMGRRERAITCVLSSPVHMAKPVSFSFAVLITNGIHAGWHY
jgi:hypothetical protein